MNGSLFVNKMFTTCWHFLWNWLFIKRKFYLLNLSSAYFCLNTSPGSILRVGQTKWRRLWWPLKQKGSQSLFLRCSKSPLSPMETVNCPKYVLKNHWNRNWFAHKVRVLVSKSENCSLVVLLSQGTFQYLTENQTTSAAVPLQRYKTALLQYSHDPEKQIFQGQI